MIPKRRRIPRNIYPNHSQRREFFSTKQIVFSSYPPVDSSKSRFSVVISKKVVKTAVLRNTYRRKIYEALRRHQEEFDTKCSGRVVISLKISPVDDANIESALLEYLRHG